MRRLAATLPTVAAIALAGPAAAAPLFGYQDNTFRDFPSRGVTPAQSAGFAKADGATVHRFLLDWQYAQPTQGGPIDFAPYDPMYDQLYRVRGIRPLIVLMKAPPWAWDPGTSTCTGNCHVPPGRSHMADWRAMAAAVAARYPGAAGIEVWNEPNLRPFWQTTAGPDAQWFEEVLANAYQGIKSANPSMPVIAGGYSNNMDDGAPIGTSLATFLDRVYKAGGKQYMDAIGFHPYPAADRLNIGPGSVFQKSFDQVRQVAAANGDAGRRLWVTEVGYSTYDDYTEQQQADGLVAIYRKVMPMSDVDALIVHALIDPPGPEAGFGVVQPLHPPLGLFRPKPAYCALAAERGVPKPTGCV
ncbi:MAG TPA: hypothetical protein VF520_15060 [Thermoleophilaceae bacterium]